MLSLAEVKWIEVPKYEELSVSGILKQFKEDARLMAYLPDRLPKGRLPDRKYFFNVLHSVYPEYVRELIRRA